MFSILSENNQAATQTVAAKIQTLHGRSGEQVLANVLSNSWTEFEVCNNNEELTEYYTYIAPNRSEHYQCIKCHHEYSLNLEAGSEGWIGCPECGDVDYSEWITWYNGALDRWSTK